MDQGHDRRHGIDGHVSTFRLGAEYFGGGMMNIPPEQRGLSPLPAWLFYFTADDIQSAAQRVKQNGGTLMHGPVQVSGGGWILQGIDAEGCSFALTAGR